MDEAGIARPAASIGRTRVRLRDFSRSLPMSLLRAREAVMHHFRASLRHHNLTEQQWRVLRALTTVEAIEITELAHATFLLPPSLSRIIRDLEERGLVARRSAEADLRRALVSISAEGLRLIETVSPASELIYGRIAGAFGSERLALLQELLRELETCLSALPGHAVGAEPVAEAHRHRRRRSAAGR